MPSIHCAILMTVDDQRGKEALDKRNLIYTHERPHTVQAILPRLWSVTAQMGHRLTVDQTRYIAFGSLNGL